MVSMISSWANRVSDLALFFCQGSIYKLTFEGKLRYRYLAGNWAVGVNGVNKGDVSGLHNGKVYCGCISVLAVILTTRVCDPFLTGSRKTYIGLVLE